MQISLKRLFWQILKRIFPKTILLTLSFHTTIQCSKLVQYSCFPSLPPPQGRGKRAFSALEKLIYKSCAFPVKLIFTFFSGVLYLLLCLPFYRKPFSTRYQDMKVNILLTTKVLNLALNTILYNIKSKDLNQQIEIVSELYIF